MKDTIYYKTTQIKTIEKKAKIEDENFICIESYIDGKPLITAFIGSKEGEKGKLKIEISSMGGFLNIERMYGSAYLNASDLISKDIKNRVLSNASFLEILKFNIYFAEHVLNLLPKRV